MTRNRRNTMNTKPTEATPSVVASLQTPAKDFNFQSVWEAAETSKQSFTEEPKITKSVLDDLLSKQQDTSIFEKSKYDEQLYEDLHEFDPLESYTPKVEPNELNNHINQLIDLLQKDYSDKPGIWEVIVCLTRSESEEEADFIFNEFVRECEESDLFHDGVIELQETVKNKGIIHNSLLEEAHFLFTKEEPKNPYEKEFQEIDAYIESEKEKVWKALKVGTYYNNLFSITKKTKKYVTIEYGDKLGRFCKDDMTLFNKRGICTYFNLWDENSLEWDGDCLATVFCTDKQEVLTYIKEQYGEEIADDYLQSYWNNRPLYIKNVSLKSWELSDHPSTFYKEFGYDTLKKYGTMEPRNFWNKSLIYKDDSGCTVGELTEKMANNKAIRDAIYTTSWADTKPEAFNDMLKNVPIVDTMNLSEDDITKIKELYVEKKDNSEFSSKGSSNWIDECTKAEAVLQIFSEKRSN